MGNAADQDSDVSKPRAWIIALSCSWINLFVFVVFRSAGVLYHSLLLNGCTHVEAAWPITLASGVAAITCLPAGFLSHYLPIRTIVSAGILITSSSIAICFFTDSITSITLFLGVAQGVGIGFITGLLPVIIGQYFGKKSTAACGLSYAGAGAGAFIAPIVFQYLLDSFGLRGSLLIMGSLTLHAIAGALLLSPPTDYPPLARRDALETQTREETTGASGEIRNDDMTIVRKDSDVRACSDSGQPLAVNFEHRHSVRIADASGREEALTPTTGQDACISKQATQRHDSQHFKLASDARSRSPLSPPKLSQADRVFESKESFLSENDQTAGGERESTNEQTTTVDPEEGLQEANSRMSIRKLLYSRMVQDARLLQEPYFFLITLTYVSYILGSVSLLMILPNYVVSLGQEPQTAVLLLSFFSLTDLLGRLLPAGLSCFSISVSNKLLYISSIGLMGILFCLYPIIQSGVFGSDGSFLALVCLTLCCGFVSGCQMILPPVLAAEMLGHENTAMAFALSNFFCGFLSFSRPFLFRRLMVGNNYDGVFYFFGILSLVSCLAWILEIIHNESRAKRYQKSLDPY